MNYNTLMNKPTINYRELIGDNTVSEVGGITEEEFNTLMSTDLASYYTKAEIDELFSRSYVYREKSGSIVTFDCPESTTSGISEVTSEIVAVQSGTGDPSPTNVRPISGWSAVNVYDNNGNWWDEQYEIYGSGASARIGSKNPIPCKGGVTYYITQTPAYGWKFYDKDMNVLATYYNKTYTAPQNACFMSFQLDDVYGTTYNHDVCISTVSDDYYTPYNGQTYTTQLKDGQGNSMTCYGGTLSNENGVQRLVLTHGYIASYNGETLPSTWISDRDVYAEGTTPSIGAEVVYTLATPQQIQQYNLAISSQDGTNNLWADSGDITVNALDKIIQG